MTAINLAEDSPDPTNPPRKTAATAISLKWMGSQASYLAAKVRRLKAIASFRCFRRGAIHYIQVKLHQYRVGDFVERQVMGHPKIAPVERKTSVNPFMPVVLRKQGDGNRNRLGDSSHRQFAIHMKLCRSAIRGNP